jgi:hypothetical protein
MKSAVHFVGFGRFDQQYWNAVRAFGPPAFLHACWDRRSRREIADEDCVVFAKGAADQPYSKYNGNDEHYL